MSAITFLGQQVAEKFPIVKSWKLPSPATVSLDSAGVRTGDYHVMILDLMMPKLDGIEVLKRVRAVDSDIAVVIFTAHPNLDSAEPAVVQRVRAAVTDQIVGRRVALHARERLAEIVRIGEGLSAGVARERHERVLG